MKNILMIILITGLVSVSAFAQESLEKELEQIELQIQEIEERCTPLPGTAKEEVEKIFGEGKPASNSKIPTDIPPDSPYMSYKLCDNGILFVRYDDNKVILAHYIDSHSTKGIPIGQTLPIEIRLNEARQRLKQMKLIEEEYLKKIKKL